MTIAPTLPDYASTVHTQAGASTARRSGLGLQLLGSLVPSIDRRPAGGARRGSTKGALPASPAPTVPGESTHQA